MVKMFSGRRGRKLENHKFQTLVVNPSLLKNTGNSKHEQTFTIATHSTR